MKLLDLLRPEAVVSELAAKNKKQVLDELCQVVSRQEGLNPGPLLEVLLERERLGSTGIGDGIAIPHGKTDLTDHLLVACGRSSDGVEFESMDGKPTHIFFLLIAPENTAGAHLKALAKISRLLKDQAFRQEFMAAPGAPEIFELIAARDDDF